MHFQSILSPENAQQNNVARTSARPAAAHHADSSLARILVAGHDKKTCALLRDYLEQNGYEVSTVASGTSLQQCWGAAVPDLAILDSTLPDLPMLLPQLKARHPFVPLIMLAGTDAIGVATEALRLGAEQFLLKPFDLPVMAAVIQRHLDHQRLRRRHIAEKLTSRNLHPFAGECDAVRSLADLARKAALSDRPVVIQGERGTGKRLLASWLHENGRRASRPFIELNFGSLLRSGNERQDDTDLFDRREQRLAAFPGVAHGGTVVLTEIQSTDLKTQAKLLRMLGMEASGRSGTGRSTGEIRLVATTQENLAELVRARRLRADLYSRMSGFTLPIPPLRERLNDLPMLAVQILGDLAYQLGNRDFDLTRQALQVLQTYSWPGNIRELRIVLERAALLARSTFLTAADLRLGEQTGGNAASRLQYRSLREMEREYVEHVLQSVGGRVQAAAKILDVPRSSLYHKLKQYRFERTGMQSASSTGALVPIRLLI